MFILKNRNNVCIANGDLIEFGIFDEPINKWKISSTNNLYYMIDFNFLLNEVDSTPNDYKNNKYCYTEEKGFYINDNYSEPINAEDEMKRLIQENIDLKAQLDKVQEVLDYLVMQ